MVENFYVKETLDYEKFKPITNGLFCEKIFGPINSFECSCKKYKKISKKVKTTKILNICPKCKVEMTSNRIRNYRLG
jgi:DNA-directed RNA polymerase subunit beta'